MNASSFEQIAYCAKYLKIDVPAAEIAAYVNSKNLSETEVAAIGEMFSFLEERKRDISVRTLLKTSRLPQKQLKTFENFDFTNIHGKDIDLLKNLPTLSTLYARNNLAFIGPQGVGKTHLAMAYGRECCLKGMKAFYLKASELNDRLTKARKYGREGSVVNGLVKPSCLIIDEIGRCIFDEPNTRLFFDIVDRRNEKEGPNTMIFTSNKQPNTWRHYFTEEDSLLCALDRIFDEATVYIFKGKSYRGRKLKTVALEAGIEKALPKPE